MSTLADSFWRAVAYCLHPKVILWSLLPLLVAAALCVGLGLLFWGDAVAAVRGTLSDLSLIAAMMDWLDSLGLQRLHAMVAPLIIVALAVPAVVVLSLLLVATLMTPAIVELVAARRFPDLQRQHGGTWLQGLAWSLACTLAAMVAMVLSIPLWFVPPLVMVLPPLIWGWLTYRVFAFDVLASHASVAERRQLIHDHRWPLLGIGVVCGYLGAAPSLLWAASAMTLILAPVLVVVSVWLYTLVFAFSACWFAHYALAALDTMRRPSLPWPPAAPAAPTAPELLPPA